MRLIDGWKIKSLRSNWLRNIKNSKVHRSLEQVLQLADSLKKMKIIIFPPPFLHYQTAAKILIHHKQKGSLYKTQSSRTYQRNVEFLPCFPSCQPTGSHKSVSINKIWIWRMSLANVRTQQLNQVQFLPIVVLPRKIEKTNGNLL